MKYPAYRAKMIDGDMSLSWRSLSEGPDSNSELLWNPTVYAPHYDKLMEQAREGATVRWTFVFPSPGNALAWFARWVHCIIYKMGVRGWAPGWGKWVDLEYEVEGKLKLLEDGAMELTVVHPKKEMCL